MQQVHIIQTDILFDGHTTLKQVRFNLSGGEGPGEEQSREIVQPRDAATCLLYNRAQGTVLLTRQFRLATYLNGNATGLLLETPAGLLEEGEAPSVTMVREIAEETGYAIGSVCKVLEAYSSPGSYTERLHYFVAEYEPQQRVTEGGGLEEEGEDIELVELPFARALELMETGVIKDVKTIVLLQYAAWKRLLDAVA